MHDDHIFWIEVDKISPNPYQPRKAFDGKLGKYKDRAQADELIARMSQIKNYFGFKGNEMISKSHLDYARANYVRDTGLDNNMTDFFDAITPDNESEVIKVMNKYAF